MTEHDGSPREVLLMHSNDNGLHGIADGLEQRLDCPAHQGLDLL